MTTSAAATRLLLLEGYLEEDAGNEALRLAAFEAAREAGELAAAAALAEAALARGQHAAPWLHRLAQVRLAQGDAVGARALLAQAQQAGALAAIIDHDLAWLADQRGDSAHAIELLRPHVEAVVEGLDPAVLGSLQVLWLRALHRSRQFAPALAWLATRQAGRTLQPAARGAASLLAWDAGLLTLAGQLAGEAVAAQAGDVDARVTLAGLALMRRQNASAEQHLRIALQARPSEGRTWFVLGASSLQRGDVRQGRDRFEQATQRMPLHIGSWHGLGWACLLQQDAAAAQAAFERALALDPAFAESQGAMALVHATRGDAAAAHRHLRAALKLEADNVTARYARAVLAGEAGPGRLRALAARLLDRPGFFGGSLAADALGVGGWRPVSSEPS